MFQGGAAEQHKGPQSLFVEQGRNKEEGRGHSDCLFLVVVVVLVLVLVLVVVVVLLLLLVVFFLLLFLLFFFFFFLLLLLLLLLLFFLFLWQSYCSSSSCGLFLLWLGFLHAAAWCDADASGRHLFGFISLDFVSFWAFLPRRLRV